MSAEHLAVIGKCGVGNSTTAANLAAALAEQGRRVVLVGYDPERCSTLPVRGTAGLQPLPGRDGVEPAQAVGYRGVLCIEAGGADPGAELPLAGYRPDYLIHDLSRHAGAPPMLPVAPEGTLRVLGVTSAEMGAISVLNDLFRWLNTVAAADCSFVGVVANNISGALYHSIVSDFAAQTGSELCASVSHSLMVSVSDFCSRTVIEAAPLSHVSYAYRKLARTLLRPESQRRPRPLDPEALQRWGLKWGEIITELETGVVRDGSSI